jgi:hypothetical protein
VEEQRKETDDGAAIPAPVNFEPGPGLLPLLPVPVKGPRGTELAKQAQEIVRAYFTRHYRKCSN